MRRRYSSPATPISASESRARSIMIATLDDLDLLRLVFSAHPVNEAVLMGDAPRPVALKRVFERLRLTETFGRIAPDVSDQFIDRVQDIGIRVLPAEVFLPGVRRPDNPHRGAASGSDRSCS